MISTMGGDKSGYASTGMRRNEKPPAITMKPTSIRTKNLCFSANWTIRLIIEILPF
jgi:hypothetical protein